MLKFCSRKKKVSNNTNFNKELSRNNVYNKVKNLQFNYNKSYKNSSMLKLNLEINRSQSDNYFNIKDDAISNSSLKYKSDNIIYRLQGSRFRIINEYFYKNTSEDVYNKCIRDPQMFQAYHEGYELQKQNWPIDPLNEVIKYINNNPNIKIIGDFGCGTGIIGSIYNNRLNEGYKVFSFDLARSKNSNLDIIVCNIKNVPLKNCQLDMALYCLSLMGIDWPLFLAEAYRVLKINGILLIVEVTSRIPNIQKFIYNIELLNFKLMMKPENLSSFFTMFVFKKNKSKILLKSKSMKFGIIYKLHYYGFKRLWLDIICKILEYKQYKQYIRILNIANNQINEHIMKPCLYRRR
ncbi:hypothetical protein cand_016540 [Cryptosporidium andersoni]|uniref:Ribosomal RNA-processing protein 8 n=1 Tax=Cryptosporidium andersoni TaxID=117008 RepID=A0A1J4MTJ9_9CRYT|nr:hypothetical protein cand_016540 [Cryptosporidium andersoni]